MAISITSSPTASKDGQTLRIISAYNPAFFTFTAGAAETAIQVAIYDSTGSTLLEARKAVPFNGTTAQIDLAPLLSSQFSIGNDSEDELVANAVETSRAFGFRVAYREPGGSYTVDGNTWYAIRGVLQFGDADAPNFASYIVTASGSPLAVDTAGLFLTEFDTVKYFFYNDGGTAKPWLPSLSFYIPDEFGGEVLSITGLGGVSGFPGSGGTASGDTLYQYTADTSFAPTDGTAYTVEVKDGAEVLYSKSVLAVEVCNNPTAIKWRNRLGGWDVWVFEGRRPGGYTTERFGEFSQPLQTIGTQFGVRGAVGVAAFATISVSADLLSLNEALALRGIADSSEVYYYAGELTDATYTKWMRVVCTSANLEGPDTYDAKHRIDLDFELPQTFSTRN